MEMKAKIPSLLLPSSISPDSNALAYLKLEVIQSDERQKPDRKGKEKKTHSERRRPNHYQS